MIGIILINLIAYFVEKNELIRPLVRTGSGARFRLLVPDAAAAADDDDDP